MKYRMDMWQIVLSASIVLMLLVVAVLGMPGMVNATQRASYSGPQANLANYGSTSENGSAGFFGIGTDTPTRILTVTGSGPGTVPWFQRGTDSAGFIIERTPTNRWVLGVNESPALGKGFVLSTYPVGAGSSTPRLMVDTGGRVGINTTSPYAGYKLTVVNDNTTNYTTAIMGTTQSDNTSGVSGAHIAAKTWGTLGGNSGQYGYGVYGQNDNSTSWGFLGGMGSDTSPLGVYGQSAYGPPISPPGNFGGLGSRYFGAYGISTTTSPAVFGWSTGGYGVYGRTDNLSDSWAGYFEGPVYVSGFLAKAGGGFKIDHPQDPANKYLQHSFVESPDMKNVYDGTAVLDEKGESVVQLPAYFESLSRDFRYQLTAIGAPGPNLYIAQKISANQFKIAGGTAGAEVSWQVTGSRKDAWALANPIKVEADKAGGEKGQYLHPELYGKPALQAMNGSDKMQFMPLQAPRMSR